MTNGGGVPINDPEEFAQIAQLGAPMLVRTYAGTKNLVALAKIYEQELNISWHALSFWWFNRLDKRGASPLYESLKEHFATLRYIARIKRAFEANVPHHFAFRGGSDVTYVVSGYLSCKAAKLAGIKTFILQVMLNTPRVTSGLNDLAKARALLQLVKELASPDFKIILQPRAGLDYFKPDLKEAQIQLAAVTALMDDIEPDNPTSPQIIHVVSYSEAKVLACPAIIEQSIKITLGALQNWRNQKDKGQGLSLDEEAQIQKNQKKLCQKAQAVIGAIEKNISAPYTPEGFYLIFTAGFLPVPYLWGDRERYPFATNCQVKMTDGFFDYGDQHNQPITSEKLIATALANLEAAQERLNKQQLKK